MLSAFFGLDDTFPGINGCPNSAGLDGIPVVFRDEIQGASMQATDFRFTTANGIAITALCATFLPSQESNENRTVLLIGEFGDDPADPPVLLEIVGQLLTETDSPGGARNLQNEAIAVTPLASGPFMVFAERMTGSETEIGVNVGGAGGGCPVANTLSVLKLVWCGGVTLPSGDNLGAANLPDFQVVYWNANLTTTTTNPTNFADLGDTDNNVDLCMAMGAAARPLWIKVSNPILQDPNGDLNAPTMVNVDPCPYDLNADGMVNNGDVAVLNAQVGQSGVVSDLNLDGTVDLTDLNLLVAAGPGCAVNFPATTDGLRVF